MALIIKMISFFNSPCSWVMLYGIKLVLASKNATGSSILKNTSKYILLAPAEGWGSFGPLGALRALLGAFSPKWHCNIQTLNFKLWKIGNLHDFDCNFALYRGKIWLYYYIIYSTIFNFNVIDYDTIYFKIMYYKTL